MEGAGVPVELMECPPGSAPDDRRSSLAETRFSRWAPPHDAGLCALNCGCADFAPGGYDLLVWYRSHGRERCAEVAQWLANLIVAAGWPCVPSEAAWVIRCAMERVRAGRRRLKHTRPRLMGEKQFDLMLTKVSAWLRAGIMDAEYRYWRASGWTSRWEREGRTWKNAA